MIIGYMFTKVTPNAHPNHVMRKTSVQALTAAAKVTSEGSSAGKSWWGRSANGARPIGVVRTKEATAPKCSKRKRERGRSIYI